MIKYSSWICSRIWQNMEVNQTLYCLSTKLIVYKSLLKILDNFKILAANLWFRKFKSLQKRKIYRQKILLENLSQINGLQPNKEIHKDGLTTDSNRKLSFLKMLQLKNIKENQVWRNRYLQKDWDPCLEKFLKFKIRTLKWEEI